VPVVTRIDHESRIVYNSLSGLVTLKDFDELQSTVGMDASLFGYDEIFNFTTADEWAISNDEVIKIAKKANTLPSLDPNACLAVVCTSFKGRSLVKLYSFIKKMLGIKSRVVHVFDTVDKAEVWVRSQAKSQKR